MADKQFELFCIYDSLNGNALLDYVLTDNKDKCFDIFYNVDTPIEDDSRCYDEKLNQFFKECKEQGVFVQLLTHSCKRYFY